MGVQADEVPPQCLNPRNRAKHSFAYQLESSDVPTYRYLHLLPSNCRGETEGYLACQRMALPTAVEGQAFGGAGQVVTLISRPQPLGGVRWYFFCPMWCSRRVRKLYLGGPGWWFGCRICRELTYTSAQTHDRHTAGFQRNPWLLRAALKAHWRMKFKAYKFVLAKHRRWWSKASAWSLTISGTS
jgi:hypothetical protein